MLKIIVFYYADLADAKFKASVQRLPGDNALVAALKRDFGESLFPDASDNTSWDYPGTHYQGFVSTGGDAIDTGISNVSGGLTGLYPVKFDRTAHLPFDYCVGFEFTYEWEGAVKPGFSTNSNVLATLLRVSRTAVVGHLWEESPTTSRIHPSLLLVAGHDPDVGHACLHQLACRTADGRRFTLWRGFPVFSYGIMGLRHLDEAGEVGDIALVLSVSQVLERSLKDEVSGHASALTQLLTQMKEKDATNHDPSIGLVFRTQQRLDAVAADLDALRERLFRIEGALNRLVQKYGSSEESGMQALVSVVAADSRAILTATVDNSFDSCTRVRQRCDGMLTAMTAANSRRIELVTRRFQILAWFGAFYALSSSLVPRPFGVQQFAYSFSLACLCGGLAWLLTQIGPFNHNAREGNDEQIIGPRQNGNSAR